MDMRLQGRSVLVTGGSKGIGRAIGTAFAREGCRVHLVARSGTELDAAAAGIRAETGQPVEVTAIDVGAPGAAERIAARAPDLDILVNNAGAIPGGTLEEVGEAAWRAAWDVKVYGTINLSRACFGPMKARGGVIVNVIGAAGEILDASYLAGSVGNAALMAFTKSLGSTSVDHGIRVVGINPGPVATDRVVGIFKRRAAQRFGDESRWKELEAACPMGRPASVEEIAHAAVWLASPLSAYTSGTILTIDAGMAHRRSIA
jgi:NAD(P)-dependent dehydrogenase (short-subunit alcohol dehydrogenase family)